MDSDRPDIPPQDKEANEPQGPVAEPEKTPPRKKNPFVQENTSEYDLEQAWEGSSARSEIAMDSPMAVEDTREVVVPDKVRRRRRRMEEVPDEIRSQWEEQKRVVSRIRLWFYSDPVVVWFFRLPRATRRLVNRGAWILTTSALIVAVFSTSAFGIYPLIAEYVRPAFAPRPESPVRMEPRGDRLFDLVEERRLSAREFRLASDCLWVVPRPGLPYEVETRGLQLLLGDEVVAELDIRFNWNGLLRLYFGAGQVPEDEDLYVRIPLRKGGLWRTGSGRKFTTWSFGGEIPSFAEVGPIRFAE